MLFSSIPFLYYFLPVVLILYFISPDKFKNSVLLVSSLFFYAWGEPRYVLLMGVTIIIGYIFGLLIEKYRDTVLSRIFLILSVTISLAFLGYFKYAGFFAENFAALTGLSIPALKIALPIGISFYTFQLLSYTIDVYRKEVPAQRNLLTLGAYIALFPQLIAGPIVRYRDVELQLHQRNHSFDKAASGVRRFILGLAKKILIANALGELCSIFRASEDPSILFYWLYAVAFTLHIYFDFSGYSDMAIGLGKIFGFEFMENFNYPYISRSITEFWRRWHMSLGSWFRDYVYIPLGGNRCSLGKWLRNLFIVWFLTGFWHGAAWNFILWGLFFAVLLIIEKLWLQKIWKYFNNSLPVRILQHVYVLFFVIISFVIFDAVNLSEAFSYIGAMFGAGNLPFISPEFLYYLESYGRILILAVVGATPLPKLLYERVLQLRCGEKTSAVITPLVLGGLLLIMTAHLVDGSYNPFLYFRF